MRLESDCLERQVALRSESEEDRCKIYSLKRSLSSRQQGFTLVEIMVVVAVIAILVGLAVISVGGRAERDFEQQVDSVFYHFRLLSDQAVLAGQEYGAVFDLNGFEGAELKFLVYDDQSLDWRELADTEGLLANKILDASLKLHLKRNEEDAMDLSLLYEKQKQDEVKDYGDTTRLEPDIVFFSDGQLTSFELTIEAEHVESRRYVIQAENFVGLRLVTE